MCSCSFTALYHHPYGRKKSRISNPKWRLLPPTSLNNQAFRGRKRVNFDGFCSLDPYETLEHVKISILTKSQPPSPQLRPENAPNTLSISINLNRSLHEPFKIKELGLLTYIFRKSASRRFLWCSSHPLTPSGRRDMSQTLFLPTKPIWQRSFEIILHIRWGCANSHGHTKRKQKAVPNNTLAITGHSIVYKF